MNCSFRLIPNELKGGDSGLLTLQGCDDYPRLFGKKCSVKVFEIDSSQEGGRNDLLAEFETVLQQAPLPDRGKFDSSQTRRTDSFDAILPGPEYKNDPMGNRLPVPLTYTPTHFKLRLFGDGQHTIFIRSDKDEVDGCMFEIGFSITVEGKVIFTSLKGPAMVDCSNVLAENCANAAKFLKDNHDQLVTSRGVGTHFGSKFPYYQQQTGAQDYRSDPAFSQSYFEKFKQDRANYGLRLTSCIDFVKSCMEIGFSKSGMGNDWRRVWGHVKDGRGDLLAQGLVKSGWKAYYYNPDVIHPSDDGPPGTQTHKNASEHTFSYGKAKEQKVYYGIPVSGSIVNYYPTTISSSPGMRQVASFHRTPSVATSRTEIPRTIRHARFGFVVARGGMHTALYSKGKIMEVHWDVGPHRSSTHPLFDVSDFATEWSWNSGVIVFPPGEVR